MIKRRYIKRMYGEVLCCDNCEEPMICEDIDNALFDDPIYKYKCPKCGTVVALKLEETPSPFKFEYEDEVE